MSARDFSGTVMMPQFSDDKLASHSHPIRIRFSSESHRFVVVALDSRVLASDILAISGNEIALVLMHGNINGH